MSDQSHYDVISRVVERLQALDLSPVKPNMIYMADFPFDRNPAPGIACSELIETEGTGTIAHDDYMYGVQLTRIFGSGGHGDYHRDQSRWRQIVRREFHRKLLGEIDGEIITKVRPSTIKLSRMWRDSGVDANVLELWTWVREERYERIQ